MLIKTTSNALEKVLEKHFATKNIESEIHILTDFNDHEKIIELISCQGKFFGHKNSLRFDILYNVQNNRYEIQISENGFISEEDLKTIHTELTNAIDNLSK